MSSFYLVLPNGETRTIPPDGLRLGRAPESDVKLDVIGVSRLHATVWTEGDQAWIRDEGSTNGTYLNGALLTPQTPHPLRPGDILRIETVTVGLSATSERVAVTTAPRIAPGAPATQPGLDAGPPHTAPPTYMDASSQPGTSPGFAGPPTSVEPASPGCGWRAVVLTGLGVLLIAALVAGGTWWMNRARGSALARATLTPIGGAPSPTLAGPTATPMLVPIQTPTATPGGAIPTALPGAPGAAVGGARPVFPVPTIALKTYPAPQLLAPPDGSRFAGPSAVIVLKWASVGALAANDYYVVTLNCATGIAGGGKPLMARAPVPVTVIIATALPLPTTIPLPTAIPLPTQLPLPTALPPIALPTARPLPTMIPLPTGLPTFTLPITLPLQPGMPLLPGTPIQVWTKDTQWRVPPEIYSHLIGSRECVWWVMVSGFGATTQDGKLVGVGVSMPSAVWAFVWEK